MYKSHGASSMTVRIPRLQPCGVRQHCIIAPLLADGAIEGRLIGTRKDGRVEVETVYLRTDSIGKSINETKENPMPEKTHESASTTHD